MSFSLSPNSSSAPRKNRIKKLAACLMLLSPLSAKGEVDLKTGAFFFDWELSSKLSLEVPIRLKFNSMSLHRGIFGIGFCSELDYYRTNSHFQYCSSSGMIVSRKASPGLVEELDGKSFAFQSDGKLVEIVSATKVKLNISRLKNALHLVEHNGSKQVFRKIELQGDFAKKITGAEIQGSLAEFHLANGVMSQLKLRNEKNHFYYDQDKRMIRIIKNDELFRRLEYFDQSSLLALQENSVGCRESYTYKMEQKEPRTKTLISRQVWTKRRCQESLIEEKKYEFVYKKLNDGTLALIQLNIEAPENSSSVEFDPTSGRLVLNSQKRIIAGDSLTFKAEARE